MRKRLNIPHGVSMAFTLLLCVGVVILGVKGVFSNAAIVAGSICLVINLVYLTYNIVRICRGELSTEFFKKSRLDYNQDKLNELIGRLDKTNVINSNEEAEFHDEAEFLIAEQKLINRANNASILAFRTGLYLMLLLSLIFSGFIFYLYFTS